MIFKSVFSWIHKFGVNAMSTWKYVSAGVWSDTRNLWWVNLVKTLNLAIKSFLNKNLQMQACGMAFRTLLAVVPALALLFAIGRGFGFQNLLQEELLKAFPAQNDTISAALSFADSYLDQTSEGIFVGIGIVFLLYTLISLLSNVEDTFNIIWDVKEGRSIARKITDYTAILLILPILMICASGILIMVTNTLQSIFHFAFLTPIIKFSLEALSYVMTWLFFALVFMLIPNTRVKFRYALPAGIITGTGFLVLQWLFVTGQMYVARYNAIYGSFSFLPLLLLWMQFAWVICLSGCLLCYSAQNIFRFSFSDDINSISDDYRFKVTVGVMAAIVQKFAHGKGATGQKELIAYGIPPRLTSEILDRLVQAQLISKVVITDTSNSYGYQPALDPDEITLQLMRERLINLGHSNFIPEFDQNFNGVEEMVNDINRQIMASMHKISIKQINISKYQKHQES